MRVRERKIWKSKIVEIKKKRQKKKKKEYEKKRIFFSKKKKGRPLEVGVGFKIQIDFFFFVTNSKSLAYICLLPFGFGWINGFNPILSGLRVLEKENQNLKDLGFWISLHLIKKKEKQKALH